MSIRKHSSRLVLILACACAVAASSYTARPASAQVLYGSIVGTLTDQTGAVVPKATVTVTNTATGLSRQATTNTDGYYSIPNLQEGTYDLSITAGGFKTHTQRGVTVPINAATRIDAVIQLGTLAEEV